MNPFVTFAKLAAETPRRALALLALFFAVLAIGPAFMDRYLLSVFFLIFWFATVGQAWNIMMGLCGQLSLGHALYVGLGGYIAAVLWVKFGISPAISVVPAMAAAMVFGMAIGWLGFRFGIEGVYFSLLTIAFAEVARIGFDNWSFVGGAAGFFIPVSATGGSPINLRGGPVLFYYVALAMMALAFLICTLLRRSKLGLAWLAVREDAEAARALGIDVFRAKMAAVLVSSAMTAAAGVVYAFYQNNLFPSQTFDMARSIEMILAPIIGGLGTLFGPILGAFILTPLGQTLIALVEKIAGHAVPGVNLVFYGLALMVIIWGAPNGVWPWLKKVLGIPEERS
ncbi:branched-chain amino acid ABC transporter permease [Phreatobacter aquaticus]|uniref:Branched-chain amino acid ABC transporter permease n=1 Tax=Phreatobacter aquaticus TaxID=2570229 RepID=A0A4D7QGP4_9HYPH|nr:branched-chain amino acid ABC transporter permease [Phreatobacter aquaticus]QCK86418.1 branched-chain amino acid ABC transporter permease [Phreatobacter aquaticus]